MINKIYEHDDIYFGFIIYKYKYNKIILIFIFYLIRRAKKGELIIIIVIMKEYLKNM